ncbi:MAG: ATP-binding protein [Verrucomicrobia bacterium]|nr:ATP-binding protein [Verrucomicrobiota bacterium]
MKTPSFRLKIALLSTVISGVVLVGFGLAAFFMISKQKIESLDTEIRSIGARHPGWITNRRDFKRLDEALGFIFGEDHRDQVILMVKDAADGNVLYASPGWPKDLDPAKLDGTLAVDPKASAAAADSGTDGDSRGGRGWGGPGRGLGPGGGGGQAAFTKIPKFQTISTALGQWRLGLLGTADTTLIIGLNAATTRAELDHLRNGFLLALPLALAFVGLGGWLVAGRALRPLRGIARTAEQVTARGLDQRIPVSNEDPEITRVILVLNRMMDRLENSFHQATRFSADASHELNTPLAIMQGELENALQEALPDSKEQQTFSALLEETQRLKTITRGLLLLARADAGQLKPTLEAVDLTPTLERMLEDLRVLAAETQLDFEVTLATGISIKADPTLLHTALLNLLVNAVKYNAPGGSIRVELESRDDHALLTIGNSGAGIPEADHARVFTRFHRVDVARQRQVEGLGLGLSLAREIVRAHGGELELQESRPGWTSFVLRMKRLT